MDVYELNSGSVESTEQMVRDMKQVSRTRTLLGPRLVLVDDLEGFDESYIAALLKVLKQRSADDGPLVITCINPFDRALTGLRALPITRVRLFSPSMRSMMEAWKCIRQDVPPSILERHAEEANGNFHQLKIRLRTFCDSRPDTHVGLFETTDALLRGATAIDTWARSNETHILATILHENCPTIVQFGDATTQFDRMLRFMQTLSDTRRMSDQMHSYALGLSATLSLRTRSSPTLHLSKRLRDTERLDLDMPGILLPSRTLESGA